MLQTDDLQETLKLICLCPHYVLCLVLLAEANEVMDKA